MAAFKEQAISSIALVLILISACSDTAGPAGNSLLTFTIVSGNAQRGRAGEVLADTLVLRVTDAEGRPVADHILYWHSNEEGVSELTETRTDGAGLSWNRWTLGGAVGGQSMQVGGGNGGTVFQAQADPGLPTHWDLYAGRFRGMQVGDSTFIPGQGIDRFDNYTEARDIRWTLAPEGIVRHSSSGWIIGLAPGVVTLTAGTTTAQVGVNATKQEVLSDMSVIGFDGRGDEVLVALTRYSSGGVGTYLIGSLAGGELSLEAPHPGRIESVALDDAGRRWTVHGDTLLSSAGGGSWQPVVLPGGPGLPAFSSARVAARPGGGIWLFDQYATEGELPRAYRREGETWVRLMSAEPVPPGWWMHYDEVVSDAAGAIYLRYGMSFFRPCNFCLPETMSFLAWRANEQTEWSNFDFSALLTTHNWSRVEDVAAARETSLAWAVVNGGDFSVIEESLLLQLNAGGYSVVPDPISAFGESFTVSVREDGVPYLLGAGRIAWLEQGQWYQHFFEQGWEQELRTAFASADGTIYVGASSNCCPTRNALLTVTR